MDFYKKLLIEDEVGNPVRYFLYPSSSGNRINHVYHLSVLIDEFKLDIKKLRKFSNLAVVMDVWQEYFR